MHRSIHRGFVALALTALTAWGCNGTTSTSTPTTTPTPTPTTTETFTGTLALNGAATHTFTANAAGSVTATLTSFGPDSTLTVGIGLGTWNGTSCAVAPGIWDDTAAQGAIVIGTVAAATLLCVRIADVSATLGADPLPYTITVVHP
jgi:hypothetical protein